MSAEIQLGGHRSDSVIRGYALVDDQDATLVEGYRWRLHSHGYAVRHGRKGEASVVYMHRQLLGLEAGSTTEVDHINGQRRDNRRANLRVCSHAENLQNMRTHRDARSPLRGVYIKRGKWHAEVNRQGECHRLGPFDTEIEAGLAVSALRAEKMPFSTDAGFREVAR